MSHATIILADMDKKYLLPLELKFAEVLGYKTDIEIVTDLEYFDKFFKQPQNAMLLLISDELYTKEILKHNIEQIFILTEERDGEDAEKNVTVDLNVERIYKYTSIDDIYNKVTFKANFDWLKSETENKTTEIIVVYSPIGGSGKTTTALGLASCLSGQFKKVLYVNVENMQTFQYFLKNTEPLNNFAVDEFFIKNKALYQMIKAHIRKEKIDFLPPFKASLHALGLSKDVFLTFIQGAKESKDYDFIIVDTDSVLDEKKARLLNQADKVVIPILQDAYSVKKIEILMNNMECNKSDKFFFFCNRFDKEKINVDFGCFLQKIALKAYVSVISQQERLKMDDLEQVEDFKKIAKLLI